MNEQTWYYTNTWGFRIEKVVVVKQTDKMVEIKQGNRTRRLSKETNDDYFCPTREQAKKWLVGKMRDEVGRAQERLDYAIRNLAIVEAL